MKRMFGIAVAAGLLAGTGAAHAQPMMQNGWGAGHEDWPAMNHRIGHELTNALNTLKAHRFYGIRLEGQQGPTVHASAMWEGRPVQVTVDTRTDRIFRG